MDFQKIVSARGCPRLVALGTIAFSGLLLASCVQKPKTEISQKSAKVTEIHEDGELVISNKTKFSSRTFGVKGSPRVALTKKVRKGGGRYQIGKPYKIRGKRYYPKEDRNLNQVGMASWYGPNFHGRLTANGEIYDQYSLSAAHPTMPLPSYAKVTNLENGRSVIVRVNDRGPYAHGRVIDLSAQAAKLLDYTHQGVTKVRVQYHGKARMDGLDHDFLMASYNGPGKAADPVMQPVQQQTMIAMAPEVVATPEQAISQNFAHSAKTVLPASAVPVPRPVLFEEGIRLSDGSHAYRAKTVPLAFAAEEEAESYMAFSKRFRASNPFVSESNESVKIEIGILADPYSRMKLAALLDQAGKLQFDTKGAATVTVHSADANPVLEYARSLGFRSAFIR